MASLALVLTFSACTSDRTSPADTVVEAGTVSTDGRDTADAAPPPVAPITPDWCEALPRPQYATLERVDLPVEVTRDWFEVYDLGEDVFAIYEPHQWQEVLSYLLVGEVRALLFDSGLGVVPIRPLVEQLTTLPVTVLNSHSHYDHVGGNHEFDRVLARGTPYTRARTAGGSGPELEAELAPEALCAPLPEGVEQSSFRSRGFSVDRWLSGGETIDLGGRQIEVHAIPGHSPDSVALFDRSHGLLLTGDSFYPGPIWLFDHGTDLAAYRASVLRLAELSHRAELVLTGHNEPIAEPSSLIELCRLTHALASGRPPDSRREDGIAVYEHDDFSLLVDPVQLESFQARSWPPMQCVGPSDPHAAL